VNPIQVHCPECQKLFYVRPEDLKAGPVKFRCTACLTYFGFNWPQPPEMTVVQAAIIDPKSLAKAIDPNTIKVKAKVSTGVPPLSRPVSVTPSGKSVTDVVPPASAVRTRTCFNCSAQVDAKLAECPHCGVIFDKVKKIRPPEPVVPPAGPEVVQAWEAIKANYNDEKRHEGFVQLCLNRENLGYASSMYRAILEVNPTEELATKMQNRIVELATAAYLVHDVSAQPNKRIFGLQNFLLALSVGMVIVGGVYAPLRSLVAVGASFMIFIVTMRFYGARS
jgi:predicted Zn finger-like uncharacterized protein